VQAAKLSDTVINAQAAPAVAEASNPAPSPEAAAPAATAMPGGQGIIQILSGPNAGKELPLLKALTTLGKPGVQVAVIAKRPHGYFITHVEGANFPVVNGKALDAQAHQLNDHDIIELAGVKMEFFPEILSRTTARTDLSARARADDDNRRPHRGGADPARGESRETA